jgi:hypothetical protein
LLVAVPIATAVALTAGYRTPVQSYRALAGRTLGAVFHATWIMFLAVLPMVAITEGLGVRHDDHPAVVLGVGFVLTALGVLKRVGIAPFRRPRERPVPVVLAAAALLATIWPGAHRLRCFLGSGDACVRASARAGEPEDRLAYLERGCARDEPYACREAGRRLLQGDGAARDLGRAERLLGDGCMLDDDASCSWLHAIELERRCDRYSASACRSLAREYGGDRQATLLRKACLLGDDDACR